MPETRFAELLAGNERFEHAGSAVSAPGRHPVAVLSCIDGRVPVEAIFDLPSDRIYSVRIAGNVVSEDVVGSLELACVRGGAALVVVMGHTGCEAVRCACEGVAGGAMTSLLRKILPAVASTTTDGERSAANAVWLDAVAAQNVRIALGELLQQSGTLRSRVDAGTLRVVGAMYDVDTGHVTFLDAADRA